MRPRWTRQQPPPLTPEEADRCGHRGPMGRRMARSGGYSTCSDCAMEFLLGEAAAGNVEAIELLAMDKPPGES